MISEALSFVGGCLVGATGLYLYGVHWVKRQEQAEIIRQQAEAIQEIADLKVQAARPSAPVFTNVHPDARVSGDAQVHRAVTVSIPPEPAPEPEPQVPVGYLELEGDLCDLADLLPRIRPAKIHARAREILGISMPADANVHHLTGQIIAEYQKRNRTGQLKVDVTAWR